MTAPPGAVADIFPHGVVCPSADSTQKNDFTFPKGSYRDTHTLRWHAGPREVRDHLQGSGDRRSDPENFNYLAGEIRKQGGGLLSSSAVWWESVRPRDWQVVGSIQAGSCKNGSHCLPARPNYSGAWHRCHPPLQISHPLGFDNQWDFFFYSSLQMEPSNV